MAQANDSIAFPADVHTARLSEIDFSKLVRGDSRESQAFFDSCIERGIFVLNLEREARGQQLLSDAAKVFTFTEELFSLDHAEKMDYVLNWQNTNSYKAVGMTKVDADGKADRCEFWTFGRDNVNGLTELGCQPSIFNAHTHLLNSFMEHSSSIVDHLLSHLNFHLQLPPGSLASKHSPSKTSGSQTRLLRYDPQPASDRRTSIVAHTDQGSITILFAALGGLQILREPSMDTSAGNQQAEEDWIYVRPVPGTAIVNCGDALRKWTNNLVKSPKHRVTYPPVPQADLTRYSVAFFARPDHDSLMCRLEGSEVIPPLGEMETEEKITAKDWHHRMSIKHKSTVNPNGPGA